MLNLVFEVVFCGNKKNVKLTLSKFGLEFDKLNTNNKIKKIWEWDICF